MPPNRDFRCFASFFNQEFDGNKDQFKVVSHLLKYPIVIRFIRIVPITWNGAIALRADFYGCKSGEWTMV